MKVTLSQSLGSRRKGSTMRLDKRTAGLLVRAGKATFSAPKGARPKVERRYEAKVETPEINRTPKPELIEMATQLGATLDGSETRSDLINIIERRRRYARRDMQATQ